MRASYHQRGVIAALRVLAGMEPGEEFAAEDLAVRLGFPVNRTETILHALLEEARGTVQRIRGGEAWGDGKGRVWFRETESWRVGHLRFESVNRQPTEAAV